MCHLEGSPWGHRPERSEGCFAIARQDIGTGMPRYRSVGHGDGDAKSS